MLLPKEQFDRMDKISEQKCPLQEAIWAAQKHGIVEVTKVKQTVDMGSLGTDHRIVYKVKLKKWKA